MPTYTYQCTKCSHQMEIFHPITANPRVRCEACGSRKVQRLLGTGAGIIFKGSGFYETDYKRDTGQAKSTVDKKSDSGPGGESKEKSTASSAGKSA